MCSSDLPWRVFPTTISRVPWRVDRPSQVGAHTLRFLIFASFFQCPALKASHICFRRFGLSMPMRCSMKIQKGWGRIDLCKHVILFFTLHIFFLLLSGMAACCIDEFGSHERLLYFSIQFHMLLVFSVRLLQHCRTLRPVETCYTSSFMLSEIQLWRLW